MYQLLIVDDEQIIREGLKDIIDWASLGFVIANVFADGQDVIEYIEKNFVDLIITDIKMDKKSGLDIAEYVQEKNLATKIILISGYKEIDLAMKAIEYGVNKYILKPIDIDLLMNAVIYMKKLLDQEEEARQKSIALDVIKSGLEDIRDDFFGELAMGSFKNPKYIISMFHFLYPETDIEQSSCFMEKIVIDNFLELSEKNNKHRRAEIYNALKNCINMVDDAIFDYRMIEKNNDIIVVLGIVKATGNSAQEKGIREQINASNNMLLKELQENLQATCSVKDLDIYQSVMEMINKNDIMKSNSISEMIPEIHDQIKMIRSSIHNGNIEMVDVLLGKMMNNIRPYDLGHVKSISAEILMSIDHIFQDHPQMAQYTSMYYTCFHRILKMNSFADVEQAITGLLQQITKTMNDEQHEHSIITQAQNYIAEHITEDISLEQLSEKYYISQSHFSRLFKKNVGENFIDFLVRKKMDYAADLIKHSQHKVYEISSLVGYKNNQYFSKTFKQYMGQTPNEYRRMARRQDDA